MIGYPSSQPILYNFSPLFPLLGLFHESHSAILSGWKVGSMIRYQIIIIITDINPLPYFPVLKIVFQWNCPILIATQIGAVIWFVRLASSSYNRESFNWDSFSGCHDKQEVKSHYDKPHLHHHEKKILNISQ